MNDAAERIDAIIVAAGSGTRLGAGIPKAFVELGGRPLYLHSLAVMCSCSALSRVILVVPASHLEHARRSVEAAGYREAVVVAGGTERWNSVRNGAVASDAGWVLVHDAARPFVTHAVIDAVLAARSRYSSVITVTPEVDTVRFFSGDMAGDTVDRSKLVRVGTPQLFKRDILLDALAQARSMATPPTDEAMLMQHTGVQVGIAWGDTRNFKITTAADLEMAEALLAARARN